MAATRRDSSGIFDADLQPVPTRRAPVLDKEFQLSSKGITFVSPEYLPEWTEVGVEMRWPSHGARQAPPIDCRGVVVQCARCARGGGFEVALLFVDLPEQAQAQLLIPAALSPASLSISR